MGMKTSYAIAILLAAGVAGWMYNGEIITGGQADASPQTIAERNEETGKKLFRVEATLFTSQVKKSLLEARGSTEASGKVEVRSETQGLLQSRHVTKGQWVNEGDLICSIKVGAREATVQQMQAQLKKAQIDYDAGSKLVKDGFATQSRVNGDKAAVDEAKAQLKSAEIELERISIRAPISGIVQDPFAKVGDMLQVGDICANVVKPDTMTMITQVSEQYIDIVSVGSRATVKLVTGREVGGEIKFIAPSADIETRTFRVEIALPNEDGAIRDGITATAKINLPDLEAHHIPSSVLTLDDTGRLGVRTVDADGIVAFVAVQIIDDDFDGVWVKGLPQSVRVITRGHEYVITGEEVDAVVKKAEVSKS